MVKLKDITRNIYSGGTPNTRKNEYWNGDIKWLSSGETRSNFIYETEKKITRLGVNNSSTKLAKKNSIVIACAGQGFTRGQVSYLMDDMYINQSIICIDPDMEMVNGLYLYYFLKNSYHFLRNLSNDHSSRGSITTAMLKNLDVNFPDVKTQKKLSAILYSIDKKIELNNKINDNLFELLKQYFREKFYKKEEKDSRLMDFISNIIGGDWGKDNPEGNNNKKVYCVRGADIPSMGFGYKGNAPIRYILEKNYNNKKLSKNNIIIEISGGSPIQSTGRTAYITKKILEMYDSPLLCTNFCRAIQVKSEILAPFVYMNLKLMYDDGIFFNWENGTTGIKNLALNDMLSNLKVKMPDENELKKYFELFNNIMNVIASNSNENIKLEQLRDTLLPKLMNGDIDLDRVEM